MLESYWGDEDAAGTIKDNDKIRLFGIIMSLEKNRNMFEKLSLGVTIRAHVDSPEFSLTEIFADVAIVFNNDELIIKLPPKGNDVEGYELLDPNDQTRIRIHRDGEISYSYSILIIHNYTNSIHYIYIYNRQIV